MAKQYLKEAEQLAPIPYYAVEDTLVELCHNEKIVSQDIRKFLTGLEKAEMLEEWKAAPRQGELVSLFPTQLMKHSKKVWRWAIELRNGHIWTYFILSALQWLPTKARRYKGQNKDIRCRNCLLGMTDDQQHLLTCPALTRHHNLINETFRDALRTLELPFFLQCFHTDKEIKVQRYIRAAELSKPKINLPQRTLQGLAEDFYERHKHKETGAKQYVDAVRNAQQRYGCHCDKGSHKCNLKNCWGTPTSLVQLLQRHFSLETDGMADALHRQRSLANWFSPYEEDTLFGATANILNRDLSGQNYFINPPFSGKVEAKMGAARHIIKVVIDNLKLTHKNPAPTRAVVIIPQLSGAHDGNEFVEYARQAGLLEITSFRAGSFRFVAPQSFLQGKPLQPGAYRYGVSIFLYCNQTSWLYDPVDWQDFTRDITKWCEQNMQEKPHFPAATVLKFAERIMPEGMARSPKGTSISKGPANPITLLDGSASPICEPNYLLYKGWNPISATKLVKINRGNRLAAAIGLFQRPLIDEIKARDPERAEQNTDRLSRTVLQMSYTRYREYQQLNKRSSEIEGSLENEFGCRDTFHHLHRRPEAAKGIESKTCLCRVIRRTKKRKRAARHLPALTKLPKQKRKRKRDASQDYGRGLLNYYAPLPQPHEQQQRQPRIKSPCPLSARGGTGDAILEARDRSLRYKS
jgi:hypothetical protein